MSGILINIEYISVVLLTNVNEIRRLGPPELTKFPAKAGATPFVHIQVRL